MNMICLRCGSYFETSSYNEICDWCVKEITKDDEKIETPITTIEVSENEIKHDAILQLIHETYVAKNKDYGNSFSKTFGEFGLTASAIRLQDKLERFKRLSSGAKQNVSDESIKDTLLDMANYAIMTVMEIEKHGER